MSEISRFYSMMQKTGVRFAYQYKVQLFTTDTDVTAAFRDAAARSPKKVEFDFAQKDFNFYAQGFTLPGRTIEQANVSFQGMTFRLPNNMTYTGTITLEVNSDEMMIVRSTCELWMNIYADLIKGGGGKKLIPNFKVAMQLLDSNLDQENIMKTYTIYGCWPSNVGDVAFGQDNTAIAKFPMTLVYQYYIEDGVTEPIS